MATAAGLLAAAGAVHANVSNFAMPINYDQGESNTLFVYGASGITGTVSSPGAFGLTSFSIGASGVTSVVIPTTYDLTTSGAVTNNDFVVSTTNASDKGGASYLSSETFTPGSSYLLNSTAPGTSYYAMGATNSIGYSSQLTIVGTQAGTTVTITPSTNLATGQTAGTPFTVALGAGQSVLYTDNGNVGKRHHCTKITSSAPIAAFGGNQRAGVPTNSVACDHTLSAFPSIDHYTKNAAIQPPLEPKERPAISFAY